MTISRVFEICNAYGSGYGHGYEHDGHDGDYYKDPELNEAYHLGYREGINRSNTCSKCKYYGGMKPTCRSPAFAPCPFEP
jgi:hypothetical protein